MSRTNLLRGLLGLAALGSVQVAEANVVTWNSWTFDYKIGGKHEGLALKNLSYQGRPLIYKISMPVIRVFYQNNICGPYADRLGGTLSPIPWANDSTLAQREFSLDGRQWYEIGIRDQIGNYDLYQVYYLSSDGILDAHIYGKGLQCSIEHLHYPNWRIDFDVDGAANDLIEHSEATGFQPDPTEFDLNATVAANHLWRVRDAVTGLYVDVLPGFSDFSLPNNAPVAPVTDYSQNTVFGRLYRASEDSGWVYGPNKQVPYDDGENISNADLVAWYEGYMPHPASDGSKLWHSMGVRLVSSLADGHAASITAPTNLIATATRNSDIQLTWTASTTPGVTEYQLDRCEGQGCKKFAPIATVADTAYTDTGLTPHTSYRYQVRAKNTAGDWSGPSNVAGAKTRSPRHAQ